MTVTIIRNQASPATQVIYGGSSGPTGPAGASGAEALQRLASATIIGLRAVSVNGPTTAANTDPTDRESISAVLGVAKQSAIQGSPFDVQTLGVLTDVAFSFTPDIPIWIGVGGELTQIVPLGPYLRKVGIALTSNSMAINIGPVIRRS